VTVSVASSVAGETVNVAGVPMSALVAAVGQPRAVVVALHGGAVTSAYWDSRVADGLSLLSAGAALGFTVIALDRPGYGASAGSVGAAGSAGSAGRIATASDRVDLAYGAIDALLAGRSCGAGVFLLGHSMGCVLAVQMAADPRGAGLLGLEIAGIGVRPHAGARSFMRALTEGSPGVDDGPGRGNLRDLLWTPAQLYPDEAEAALELSASPRYEGGDVRALSDAFPSLAGRVRIPVRYTLGDHEGVWSNGPEALASIAALFTASPRVVTAEQSAAGHNLSLGRSALAYHLSVLAFAEECALIKECADRGNPDGG
jgi:pimeloyl-ACP methyl ester carboxylesterase